MEKLLALIEKLKKSEISKIVDNRIREFKDINRNSSDMLFNELCFCILTANFNAEKCILIQNKIGDGFSTLSERELARSLKNFGHRYPNTRAKYIKCSMKYKDSLKNIIKLYKGNQLRDWLVENIKGIGYKESSHFLRNIGFDNFAIIDFHIVDLLERYKLIKKPKSLTKVKYLEIENTLKDIATKLSLTPAELDLYLWYVETGKILK